jgi:tetratricopeptide (TPR) repeat protein
MEPGNLFNPFPGLRPFEPDEDHLFFGRERETDDLLRLLRSHRFLSVVGTSGSGKSSLVRCGLIPSLQSGFMVNAGPNWRVSILRPGEDPLGHLAEALDAPDVIGARDEDLASTNRVLLDATLRRGTLGLVDAVRLARIPPGDNLLILVDQFEELFRFRRSRQVESSREEAVAFVKLLLEATKQSKIPIYVVLTMRSDFIGDCMDYPGLPQAVNESQYLVPRMTRDELRSAITGPVAVAGGTIAPRLVVRLLNDVGDDQDQLPLMQHALMRAWDHWAQHRKDGQPIDLVNYEAVGTIRNALSLHAEEAYAETGTDDRKKITERIFKALTDTYSDRRGVRRPTSVADLAAICEVPQTTVTEIVEIFRRPGRSFLMPPTGIPLTSHVIVDLSHESLMRCWLRLIVWAQDERTAAAQYVRLSRQASWFQEGTAGLWGDPELEISLRWKRENRPTAAWSRRFDESFELAMDFLARSEKERERLKAERRAQRVRNLQIAWGSALVLLVAFVVAALAWSAARRERIQAESYLGLAKNAVDDSLVAADVDPTRLGAESPELNDFRRGLLERVRRFYLEVIKQQPNSEDLQNDLALAHFRLGHIDRMLDEPQEAIKEYREAIVEFERLKTANPGQPAYRQALASSFNWLGETMRPLGGYSREADAAYGAALGLQTELVSAYPADAAYRQDLARTHYNRGILSGSTAVPSDPAYKLADADFREAIRLLEPLAQHNTDLRPSQELARTYNNLAALLSQEANRFEEAKSLYGRAIQIHESLVAKDPRNREYKAELAMFTNNLSSFLGETGDTASSLKRLDRSVKFIDELAAQNAKASELIDELARPAPRLGIEQADAHTVRGRILQLRGSPDQAAKEYQRSLERFEDLVKAPNVSRRSDFNERFGDLLLNLATLSRERPENADARRALVDALGFYAELWRQADRAGSAADAQTRLDNLSRVAPVMSESDRRTFGTAYPDLQQIFGGATSNRR